MPEEAIWTSALATANFLADQRPGGTAFAIGEAGLTTALHDAGYTLTDQNPDYVVLGETRTYSFERIAQAIRLVVRGARFIATNPDPTGPTPDGLCRRAVGGRAHQSGFRRRPVLRRQAEPAHDAFRSQRHRRPLGIRRMVGDRMDTDVVSGLEAGMHTVLVLTGITSRDEAERFPVPAVKDRRLHRRFDRRLGLSRAAHSNQNYLVGGCGSWAFPAATGLQRVC